MDIVLIALAALLLGLGTGLLWGLLWGGAQARRKLAFSVSTLIAERDTANVLLRQKQDYIEGLWMPKECPAHVFPREPLLRKNGELKFACQRCGEVRWTTKAA